jgi:hypothetical protein
MFYEEHGAMTLMEPLWWILLELLKWNFEFFEGLRQWFSNIWTSNTQKCGETCRDTLKTLRNMSRHTKMWRNVFFVCRDKKCNETCRDTQKMLKNMSRYTKNVMKHVATHLKQKLNFTRCHSHHYLRNELAITYYIKKVD